jgi:N6-adenosine-specific RNA methylase IME4/ParB-like chromosome segregation protein Spo0J
VKFHDAASIFPLMGETEVQGLADDIRENGLREPIWLHPDGSVLDGRNRWAACGLAGVEPTFRTWDGKGSIIAFVVSLNLHRRHLDESQRAMVGARIKPMFEAEARERQGTRTDLQANLPESSRGQSRDQAASAVNVSARSVESAAKVIASAVPELTKAVDQGRVKVSLAAKLADKPIDFQHAVIRIIEDEGVKPMEAIRRVTASTINKAHADFPTGKYRVIYADPPWSYGNTQPDDFPEQRDHYPVMTMTELAELPVRDLAEDDSVLFLWATSPILPEALNLAGAWGFMYKASFIWHKLGHVMGHYNSVRHEFLLVCVRGSCQPDVRTLYPSVQEIERTEHSSKPEEFRTIIETLYPAGKRVELFSRRQAKGWDSYGNQAGT